MIGAVVRKIIVVLSFGVTCCATTLNLQWDPSPDRALAKYVLYRGTSSYDYDWKMDVPIASTNAIAANLIQGQIYFFAVAGVDTNGVESDFSAELAFKGNSPPVALNLTVSGNEDTPIAIQLVGTDADSDALIYQVTAGPTNGTLSGTAPFLTYTPPANFSGTDRFSYTVSDGQITSAPASVVITTISVNDPPTLDPISSLTLSEDAPAQTVALTGIGSGAPNENQPLAVTAAISGSGPITSVAVSYLSPNSTGSLTFKPVSNGFGTNVITVTVNDGQAVNNTISRSFTVVVNPINDPPTLNSISNMTLPQNAGAQTVNISGISSGVANEIQTLTVTVESSNPSLIPTPTVNYISPNSVGTVTFKPASNLTGTATLSVIVNDGGNTNNTIKRSFGLTIVSPAIVSNLLETGSDARSLTLTWSTDMAATCALEYGVTTNLGTVSPSAAIGKSHIVTLSNLEPATTYYMRVKATNVAGVTQSDIATADTESVRVLLFGAEAAALSTPMTLYTNSSAQNGLYVASSTSGAGALSVSLNTLYGLNYRLWSRIRPIAGGGSFYISLDGAPEKAVSFSDNGRANQWQWVLLGTNATVLTNCLIFPMIAGIHTLTVRAGTASTAFDEFAMVNDPNWQPILPTTKPQLTVSSNSTTAVNLTWNLNAGNAQSVAIEQSFDTVNFLRIASLPATSSFCNVTNLSALQTSYFRIFAYNSVDATGYSNVAAK